MTASPAAGPRPSGDYPAAQRLDVSVKIAPQNGGQQQYQNGRHMPAARKPSERLASMQRKQQSQAQQQ